MLGTSRLLRTLRNSNYPQDYREQMGAVVALVGRLVDIVASLMPIGIPAGDDDRQRIRNLAISIGNIRVDLLSGKIPIALELHHASQPSGGVPLLREMEKTVSLIPEVFFGAESMDELRLSAADDKRPPTFLVPDAFSNLDHLKFGLKGGLAASLCYIIYNAIAWPGISTAITTCLLTALSTVGFSRQKQILLFSGAVVGGVLFGMGAQIFIFLTSTRLLDLRFYSSQLVPWPLSLQRQALDWLILAYKSSSRSTSLIFKNSRNRSHSA
jgi:multidrug resistance protein MdtO